MTKLQDPTMQTREHWKLFSDMDELRKEEFNSDYEEFKKHVLYILEVMDKMYLTSEQESSESTI